MKAWLRRLERRQEFDPSLVGVLVNPFFLARQALWQTMRELATRAHGRLLDVGCGTKPYRALFDVTEYVGLDIDSEHSRARAVADLFYDGRTFPAGDGAFDTVLCNQVLEHVFNPTEFLDEIWRVLAPGGTLLLSVPFVWDEHEQPHDFARYSSFGLRHLLEQQGFAVTEHRKLLADFSVLCQLANAYVFKAMARRSRLVKLTIGVLVIAPISCLGLLLARVLPANPDLFLDQVVVAVRPSTAPSAT